MIGAGPAGIGAARMVSSYGRTVLILEAQNYVGGRTLTDTTTFSQVGFDLGAQFFHQALSGNILLELAKAGGNTVVVANPTVPQLFFDPASPGPVIASPTEQAQVYAEFLAISDACDNAGAAAAAGLASDVSLQTAINQYVPPILPSDPFYATSIALTTGERTGATPDKSSAQDWFNFSLRAPAPLATPGDDYLMQSGMGNFIKSLAKGLPVQNNAVVTGINYGSDPVTITVQGGGTFRAHAVIVTASAGVLQAGTIGFSPSLPATHANAISNTVMGAVYKAGLGFGNYDVYPPAPGMSYAVPLSNTAKPIFIIKYWGFPIVEVLADVDLAVQLEQLGPTQAATQIILPALENILPGATAHWDGRVTASSWLSNPYARGAYSYVKPGWAHARVDLAAGVAGRLWFAGEALSVASHGSINGAYQSGENAAFAALKAIGAAFQSS